MHWTAEKYPVMGNTHSSKNNKLFRNNRAILAIDETRVRRLQEQ